MKIEKLNKFDFGIKHETILTVQKMVETSGYIDIGYNNTTSTPLYFSLGANLTIIF